MKVLGIQKKGNGDWKESFLNVSSCLEYSTREINLHWIFSFKLYCLGVFY